MCHFIIVKLKDSSKKHELVAPVTELFHRSYEIPGISDVKVQACCNDIANRYDLMIELTMEESALPIYNESEMHKQWKREYGDLIAAKTIFDSEQ